MRFFGRKSPTASEEPKKQEPVHDDPLGAPGPSLSGSAQNEKNESLHSSIARSIPRDEVEKTRRRLKTLLLEKELASTALTRLYEYEAAKEITRDERELLAAKYRAQIKEHDNEIIKLDALIEVGDLETLRQQLIELVNQKIEAIERRIDKARPLASPLIEEILRSSKLTSQAPLPEKKLEIKTRPKVPDISNLISKDSSELSPVPKRPPVAKPVEKEQTALAQKPEEQSTPSIVVEGIETPRKRTEKVEPTRDTQAEEIQKELLEALDRLEKLDVEA